MPIYVVCPKCQTNNKLRSRAAGKRVKCSHCGKGMDVPRNAATVPPPGLAAVPGPDADDDEDAVANAASVGAATPSVPDADPGHSPAGVSSARSHSEGSKRQSSGSSERSPQRRSRSRSRERADAGPAPSWIKVIASVAVVVGYLSMAAYCFAGLLMMFGHQFGLLVFNFVLFGLTWLGTQGAQGKVPGMASDPSDAASDNPIPRIGGILLIVMASPLFWYSAYQRIQGPRDLPEAGGSTTQAETDDPPATPPLDDQVPAVAAASVNPFDLSSIPLPVFKDERVARKSSSGAEYFDIICEPNGKLMYGGAEMQMRLRLPVQNASPQSLACVLLSPSGSNPLVGMWLDEPDYETEVQPFLAAGLAVLEYSTDGGLRDLQNPSNLDLQKGYIAFTTAQAGLVNARNALEFVLTRVPEVDPQRIYMTGHGSAGTLAILFAEHEPRIKACLAFAPLTDVNTYLAEKGLFKSKAARQVFPGAEEFSTRVSPVNHLSRLGCPVFLFQAHDDTVEPVVNAMKFVEQAKSLGKNVTYQEEETGDHYASMVDEGLYAALEWLRDKRGEKLTLPERPPMPTVDLNLAAASGTLSRPPKVGERVVIFRYTDLPSTGIPMDRLRSIAASTARLNPAVIYIDEAGKRVVMGYRGGSLATGSLSSLLTKAGFELTQGSVLTRWTAQ